MSRVYSVFDLRGEQRFDEARLPLRVGSSDCGDIVIPDLPPDTVVAYIARSEGHAYIQPADTEPGGVAHPVYHNHALLSGSAWLKSGDQVQIGEFVLTWSVKADHVFIHVARRISLENVAPLTDPSPVRQRNLSAIPWIGRTRSTNRSRVIAAWSTFAVLALAAAFVLVSTPVVISVTPEPDSLSLRGFPPPVWLGRQYLAMSGRYTVRARREGFRRLEQRVDVPKGDLQEFSFELQELPGRLTVLVDPNVPFQLLMDESEVTPADDGAAEIPRGRYRVAVVTDRYLLAEQEVDVAGRGQAQTVSFTLQPAWADVWFRTEPVGAQVTVDGESVGSTPLHTEIMAGPHTIVLSLAGHKPVTLKPQVTAGEELRLESITFLPADGRLALETEPPGATVAVDGQYYGTTPLTLMLVPNTEHEIVLSKAGFRTAEQRVALKPEEDGVLEITLSPEYGVIFLAVQPADAALTVEGQPFGKATQRLRLPTRPHTLEISKPGYQSQQITVMPRAGVSQALDVTLNAVGEAKKNSISSEVVTSAGQLLRLVRPAGPFEMGASRQEAGRRANESRRLVQLTSPFYLGVKEVTNREFRRFRPSHRAGTVDGAALDGDDQPVVNVSWDDAARYSNWLSLKDRLPPAYVERQGRMVPASPSTTGYRLPTEAEWAYVARVHGRSEAARYPWAAAFPPRTPVANLADARIADTLADVVPGYDDGYRGTAPVGSFAASPPGFFDLGGNVAEWTNDFYGVFPGQADKLVQNPTGPDTGVHHVVRGSSWRHGNITELRLSYRDYSKTPRSDLGFRIARSAE